MIHKRVEYLIVGSGPGGATVARGLAQAGRQVLLLERGRDWRRHPLYGTYPGAMLYADKASFVYTPQGLNIIRPLMLGGATSMYCGCAARPGAWWREKYNINLDTHAEETITELNIAPLPPELRGVASTRMAEAGQALGMDWQPQDKFMQPYRTPRFACGATCMLGCRCGAKWNAAEFVDEAVEVGCDVWTGAKVEQVRFAGWQVAGVSGRVNGEPFFVEAETVIVSAGGIGSPALLRRSGLFSAGEGLTMDSTVIVYGHAPYTGIGQDPPMTWQFADDDLGVLYSTLIDPWLNYPVIMARKGWQYPASWRHWGQTLGVMIKLKDEVSGGVDSSGRVNKGLTANDGYRLAEAEQVAEKILLQAGCRPETIFTSPVRGTHPSGSVRIGHTVNKDLQTEIEGLYVCDASVFPEALARPTVLTIISLAKRLVEKLTNDE